MSLPKINKPTFIEKFPNSETTFSYRPFDVMEQKSVLIAAQGGNDKDVIQNMVNLVDACTFNKFDFGNRPIADFEKAFLVIRSKAVGEVIEIAYKCLHTPESTDIDTPAKPCNQRNEQDVFFLNDVVFSPQPTPLIDINENIKIKFKPVTPNDVIKNIDFSDLIGLRDKVEFVSEGENIITEFSAEDFAVFISSIPIDAAERIIQFFNSQSLALLKIPTRCKKCGNKSEIEIQGAVNFFA